jgi:hypothetical protein
VLGEEEAMVLEAQPLQIHGVTYYDVTVTFRDRSVERARLGFEAVPEGLQPGDRVLATRAMNMVIALRRPDDRPEDVPERSAEPPGGDP